MAKFCDISNIRPIRYCIQDNDNGPVCYCYTEKQAKQLVDGLYKVNNLDPTEDFEKNDYYRFAYEDMRQYPCDGHLPPLLMAQLALGFFNDLK